jgi:hypothetical protein
MIFEQYPILAAHVFTLPRRKNFTRGIPYVITDGTFFLPCPTALNGPYFVVVTVKQDSKMHTVHPAKRQISLKLKQFYIHKI